MRGVAEIQRLAEQAVRNVNAPRNADKGDWTRLTLHRLFWLLLVEVWELWWALVEYRRAARRFRALQRRYPALEDYHRAVDAAGAELTAARGAVKHEAGDCAAFLALIVDITR